LNVRHAKVLPCFGYAGARNGHIFETHSSWSRCADGKDHTSQLENVESSVPEHQKRLREEIEKRHGFALNPHPIKTMKNNQCMPAGLAAAFLVASLLTAESSAAPAQTGKLEPNALQYGLQIMFSLATFSKPGVALKPEHFAPTDLDVRSWVQTAKMAGMDFAILNAKSRSGFCLWDSKDYDFDVGGSPLKVDILKEFISACADEGIKPGVMYSIPDSLNEGESSRSGPVPPPYFSLIKQHVTELHSRYPEIKIQYLYSAERLSPTQTEQLHQIIKQLTPHCIIIGDKRESAGNTYKEASVIKEWLWRADAHFNTAMDLYAKYAECRESGQALLLNVAPDRTGRIPQAQVAVLVQLKSLIANPPSKPPAPGDAATKPPPAERLKQVKQLYEQGLINKEDYDKKVKEIMDAL
jgi:hypothetical protein